MVKNTLDTLKFNIAINADVKKVWQTMLEAKTYLIWAKEFHPSSHYEGSWQKGAEIKFLAFDDKGKTQGMFSMISECDQYQYISIKHIGFIADGKIDTTSEAVKKWTPSFENYTFTSENGTTHLKVEMQTPSDYKAMFEEMWPRALGVLKQLCE